MYNEQVYRVYNQVRERKSLSPLRRITLILTKTVTINERHYKESHYNEI